MPTIGSLFAGIGGFDLGFERAGFTTVWQVEIDKAAQGVLRRRFPAAQFHSDVREVGAHNLGPVDVLTFGSPCQDLSVAGKRAGLAGERSGLFHEAARIIRELRDRYGKPDFAIWENVPGAFSSRGGADFAAVVQALVDLGARDVCWRVLDSRHFGVAQRRRRVFLVADFGGERAEQVLFEPESLRGDSAPRRKAGKGTATTAQASAGDGRPQWPANVTCTLNAAFGDKLGLEDQHALSGASLFVPTRVGAITTRMAAMGSPEVDAGLFIPVRATGEITHPLTARNAGAATEDGSGRGVPLVAHPVQLQVRRLQPTECEALQAFPRNWTAEVRLPDGTVKPQADGPRYKQLGNAVTVNVAEWIARRLRSAVDCAAGG